MRSAARAPSSVVPCAHMRALVTRAAHDCPGSKLGMKPVCDLPNFCKDDTKSLYLGQSGHIAYAFSTFPYSSPRLAWIYPKILVLSLFPPPVWAHSVRAGPRSLLSRLLRCVSVFHTLPNNITC